jgi:hypothetical protein
MVSRLPGSADPLPAGELDAVSRRVCAESPVAQRDRAGSRGVGAAQRRAGRSDPPPRGTGLGETIERGSDPDLESAVWRLCARRRIGLNSYSAVPAIGN